MLHAGSKQVCSASSWGQPSSRDHLLEKFEAPVMRSKITHVIFDVDGLLLNSESVYTALCAKILRSFGFTLTYDLKRKLMGRKPREAAAVLVSELSPSFTASEFTNIWDRNLTEDKWLKTSSMPGAERLILHLAEHAIPMAAATGCYSYELEQKLKYHPNIRNNLSHAVTAGDDPLVRTKDISWNAQSAENASEWGVYRL
ncbi:unnamed protein product [Calicophoron daubneyi]|uniref:Uncharacterized protein n=1 Tax=Calicophoron daubneyi TaxID=300641 RepID=A0AAV2T5S0_CALDB